MRVALVASSGWSHTFASGPDLAAATSRPTARCTPPGGGDLGVWRNRTLAELDAAGQQELLNWYAMVGAMEAGSHPPRLVDHGGDLRVQLVKIFAMYAP
jgi:hypothetical protein